MQIDEHAVRRINAVSNEAQEKALAADQLAGLATAVALAATARLHLPEAAYLVLGDSDAGDVEVDGVQDAEGNDLEVEGFEYVSGIFEQVARLQDSQEWGEGWGGYTDVPRNKEYESIAGRRLIVDLLLATLDKPDDEATQAAEPTPRDERNVYRLTAADVDDIVGRQVTDGELRRVEKTLAHLIEDDVQFAIDAATTTDTEEG